MLLFLPKKNADEAVISNTMLDNIKSLSEEEANQLLDELYGNDELS